MICCALALVAATHVANLITNETREGRLLLVVVLFGDGPTHNSLGFLPIWDLFGSFGFLWISGSLFVVITVSF